MACFCAEGALVSSIGLWVSMTATLFILILHHKMRVRQHTLYLQHWCASNQSLFFSIIIIIIIMERPNIFCNSQRDCHINPFSWTVLKLKLIWNLLLNKLRYLSGHLVPKWRRINVDATSSRRIDVNTVSFLCHMPAGFALKALKEQPRKIFVEALIM